MNRNFLSFQADAKSRITALTVIKNDVLPWLLSAGVVLVVLFGVTALVASVDSSGQTDYIEASANLFIYGRFFYWALIVVVVCLARRSLGAWTWITTAILILFVLPQSYTTLAIMAMPNGLLGSMVVMLGLLAIGRLVEYLWMRYRIGLKKPRLSAGAIAVYVFVVVASVSVGVFPI